MQRRRAWRQQTLPLLVCLIMAITQGCQAYPEGDLLFEWKSSLSSYSQQKLDSWIQGSDPCTWQHVTCYSNLIGRIDLGNLSLSGPLYSGFGELPKLQYLELYANNLSGQIPSQLGNLANLVSLDLYQNSLSGTIPATLSNCTQLQFLRLENNTLQGSIPVQLTTLSKLQALDVSYNNLSGEVPVNGSFSKLTPVSYKGNPYLCGSVVDKSCTTLAPLSSPVQPSPPATSKSKLSKTTIKAIAGGVPAFIILLSAIGLAWWRVCRSADNFFDVPAADNPEPVFLGQLQCFTLWELRVASDNFHPKNVLGSGGFGKVYKGRLADGSVVAIKRLKPEYSPGGERQFQAEVEIISMAVHRNILRLRGFCITPGERLLVYPYMPNGSVASRLGELIDDTPALSSKTRQRIALGTARGLAYLHDHCDPKIIHRDVKAANVLLDEDFEALIGDFGLAKLMNYNVSQVTTAVRGTIGHIAPEYMSTGRSSEKTDVFGYGIFLLELVTGQRAIDLSRLTTDQDVMLLDWVRRLLKEDKVDVLADPHLKKNYDRRGIEALLQIALLCSQPSPKDRPKMSEVVKMIEGEGLEEHWDEWQKMELARTSEMPSYPQFPTISNWTLDSTDYEPAVELSGPR